MTHLFNGYVEWNTMFATKEKGSKFFFTCQSHDMFYKRREGKDFAIGRSGLFLLVR